MKTYNIVIVAYCPVPREFDYREKASDVSAAVSRALKNFRRDVPRKQINKYSIRVDVLI